MGLSKKKAYIYYLIASAVLLVIKLLVPAGNGLTEAGVSTLAIFAGVIILWIFVGTVWSSLLGFAALVIANVTDFTKLASVSFGHWGFAFMFSAMLLNAALLEAGVIQWISTWFISRKICKGRPWTFVVMFLGSAFLLGLVLDCLPIILVYLALIDSICQELGYQKGDKFGKLLTIGILCVVLIAYAATPISHGIAIMMLAWLDSVGYSVSFLSYISVGLPFGIAFFTIFILSMRIFCRPDFTKFQAYDPEARGSALRPFDKRGKLSVVVFLAVILMWLLPDAFASIIPPLSAFFKRIGSTIPPMLGCVVLSLIYVDDKPCFNIMEGLKKVSMATLVFVVGIQSFVYVMSDESTGIGVFLANLFAPLSTALSPGLFVAVVLFAVIILTQFLSNMVVQSLFFTAFVPVIISMNASGMMDMNVAAFGVLISITACVSFMLPSSCIASPLCYSSGYLEVSDGIKLGLPIILSSWLVLVLLIWPLASALL